MSDAATLYRQAIAADEAWSAELRRAFGSDACNRRYDLDRSSHPEPCRVAEAEFDRTTAAWLERMRQPVESPLDSIPFDDVQMPEWWTCPDCHSPQPVGTCENPGCRRSGNVPQEILDRRDREAAEQAERLRFLSIREQSFGNPADYGIQDADLSTPFWPYIPEDFE